MFSIAVLLPGYQLLTVLGGHTLRARVDFGLGFFPWVWGFFLHTL